MTQTMTTRAENAPTAAGNGGGLAAATLLRPKTDIYETPDHVVLVTDLFGVDPADVDVTLDRRVLTLRGKGKQHRPEGYRMIYAEYGEADFERSFVLSEDIDPDNVSASQQNGVLTLQLAKAQHAKPRRIEVKSA